MTIVWGKSVLRLKSCFFVEKNPKKLKQFRYKVLKETGKIVNSETWFTKEI